MSESVVIVIPGTPDSRCRPNAKCSERTRKRYRKELATTATIPARIAYNERVSWELPLDPIFPGECVLSVLVRWEPGRRRWDRDAIITSLKQTADVLQREGIIGNDQDLHWGSIEQEPATGQSETVLTITGVTA